MWIGCGMQLYTRDELFNYVRDVNSGDFLELVMFKVLHLRRLRIECGAIAYDDACELE